MKNIYILCTLLFLIIGKTNSQSGFLDSSFGNGGLVTTAIDGSYNLGQTTIIQSDGKIIVAGEAGEPTPMRVAIVRYNTDGSLDNSFGNSGSVLIPVGSARSYARDLAIQSDGKILIGAYTYDDVAGDFAVIRLNTNGTLDTTFGTNGITVVDNGSHEIVEALVLLNDGKILLAGNNWDNFLAARFNADGSLDTTFGTNGWITTVFTASFSQAKDIAVQEDGKVLLSGVAIDIATARYRVAVARFTTEGSLDPLFGTSGQLTFHIGDSDDYGAGVSVGADSKILIGGYSHVSQNPLKYDLFAVRLNSDGSFDDTFGNNGVTIARVLEDAPNYAEDILLQSDGKIILTGYGSDSDNYNLIMLRINSNGQVDSTFGIDGRVNTDINGRPDFGKAIAIQPDNKIILTGYSYSNAGIGEIVVARYENALLGTNENQNLKFKIYPNPVSEELNIEINKNISNVVVEIWSILGNKIVDLKFDKNIQIDTSALDSGVYLLKLNAEDHSSFHRFIKQ